jgi:hypothetical protein
MVVWSEAHETFQFEGRDIKHAGFTLDFGLQNNTGKDLTIAADTLIMKRLTKGRTLTEYSGAKLSNPWFVPAHQRLKVSIWLDRGCTNEDLSTGAITERNPQTCFTEEFSDSDGLVLFDPHQRFQINLPKPSLRSSP